MNKPLNDEKPLVNIERSPLVVISAVILTAILCAGTWILFREVSPYGFLVMVFAVVVTIQTFWLLMNPFALVFERRLEIKQFLFNPKERAFNDLDKVSEDKWGNVFLTYTDGEVEKLNLFGIRQSHKSLFVKSCEAQVKHTLTTRA